MSHFRRMTLQLLRKNCIEFNTVAPACEESVQWMAKHLIQGIFCNFRLTIDSRRLWLMRNELQLGSIEKRYELL